MALLICSTMLAGGDEDRAKIALLPVIAEARRDRPWQAIHARFNDRSEHHPGSAQG
jgi:hypothetical protein